MLDQFFITVNTWMMGGIAMAAVGSFLWGMISVLFSPCHLASIPLIIGYVSGQDSIIKGRQAAQYAVFFAVGLFLTIAIVGIICVLLGRMLGDIGPWWTIPVGIILLWLASDMLGIAQCSMPNSSLRNLRIKGLGGAFVLGLAYGVLSGSCTFGFIAPLLAMITMQEKIFTGLLLITLFAVGHCFPIAIAGSSAATIKKVVANSSIQQGGIFFRKSAGILIGGIGIYFILRPFLP